MFEKFWPSLFAFLIAAFIMIYLYEPAYVSVALGMLGAWLLMIGYIFLVALGLALVGTGYLLWRKQSLAANRPVDGAFPLQRYRLKGGRTLVINPNHMIGPAAVIDRQTGEYHELEHQAGWQVVAEIRQAVERSNLVRAMFPGDKARTDKFGSMSALPKINASTMRSLQADAKKKVAMDARQIAMDATPMHEDARVQVAPMRAIARNTECTFAIGNDIETGDAFAIDFASTPHVRVHGATQASGKTNVCQTIIYSAIAQGHHAIICDHRRHKDWRHLGNRAELVQTQDPQRFVDVLGKLLQVHRRRDQELAERGAANVGEIGLQRYFVMVSEFGAFCTMAKEEGVAKAMLSPLKILMRESGACGIHFVFEDQMIEAGSWPGVCIGQSKGIVGHMPSRAGQTVGYYHSDKLEKYTFAVDGQIVRTWDMKKYGKQIAGKAKPIRGRLIPPPQPVPDAVPDAEGGVREGVREGVRPVYTPPTPQPTNTDQGKWYRFVKDYMSKHPGLYQEPPKGIRALARAMSRSETGSDEAARRYSGIASSTAKQIRQERNEQPTGREQLAAMGVDLGQVALRTGDRLGIDVTQNEL